MNTQVGLGLRHSFHEEVLSSKPHELQVPWFEVITENYLFFDGHPRQFLRKIRDIYPLVFHGVSLSIGSLEPPRKDYLLQLKKLIFEFEPLWISDHLCWTYLGAENSHDLLPVAFTEESLQRITSKVQQVQEILGRKIYLENPSAYVDFAANQYSEQQFISELCKKSGCGLLLDLNNLVVNHHNLGYNSLAYLEQLKNCDVRQIHLAGHTVNEKVRIDTHDADISQEVLDLLPYAKKLWPHANPMIEWDDKIPPLSYLLEQRRKIDSLWNSSDLLSLPDSETTKPLAFARLDSDTHQKFWGLLKKNDFISEADVQTAEILKLDCPTPAVVGMNVYSSAYYSRLIEVLGKDFPVLKVLLDELFPDVLMLYLTKYPSTYDSIDFVGNNLARFIAEYDFSFDLGVNKQIISDVAAFENLSGVCSVAFADSRPLLNVKEFTEADWHSRKIGLSSTVLLFKAGCEVHPVIDAVKAGAIPEIPELQPQYYLFYREETQTRWRQLDEVEFYFFSQFANAKSFVDAINSDESKLQHYSQLLFANKSYFTSDAP